MYRATSVPGSACVCVPHSGVGSLLSGVRILPLVCCHHILRVGSVLQEQAEAASHSNHITVMNITIGSGRYWCVGVLWGQALHRQQS